MKQKTTPAILRSLIIEEINIIIKQSNNISRLHKIDIKSKSKTAIDFLEIIYEDEDRSEENRSLIIDMLRHIIDVDVKQLKVLAR